MSLGHGGWARDDILLKNTQIFDLFPGRGRYDRDYDVYISRSSALWDWPEL